MRHKYTRNKNRINSACILRPQTHNSTQYSTQSPNIIANGSKPLARTELKLITIKERRREREENRSRDSLSLASGCHHKNNFSASGRYALTLMKPVQKK